ncbi:MAG: hypothetical protein AAGC63_09745 [Propionicimonas sp.]
MTAHIHQIGTRKVVLCDTCPALYLSTKSTPQAEATRDHHNRRHDRRP